MRLLTLTLLATLAYAGDAPPLPAAVDKAYKSYVAALTKTYEAETKKVEAALKKEMESATKRGDLDAAMAVKALLEKISDGQGLVDAGVAAKTGILGEAEADKAAELLARQMEGTWSVQKRGWAHTLNIQGNGTVIASDGATGRWAVVDNCVKISWAGAQDRWEQFPLPCPGKRPWLGDSWNLGRKTITITKIAD